MNLLTASRMNCFLACNRKHHYRYELGIAPVGPESDALRVGTIVHAALEAWWCAWRDAAGLDALRAALSTFPDALDPFERVRLEAMLVGYDLVWGEEARGMEVLGVELPFLLSLVRPADGEPATTWQVAGKMDAVVRLADGRVAIVEHKCLAGDARIFDHATGTYERAVDLYERGVAPMVTALDGHDHLVTVQALPLRLASVRPIYRVATVGGRSLRVSGNHPVLTPRGWVGAEDLTPEDWVATPRHLACARPDAPVSDEAVRLVGYMIGDGSLSNMSFTKGDAAVIADVVRCAAALGEVVEVKRPSGRVSYVRFSRVGPVARLMADAGFTAGTLSKDKRAPFRLALSDRQIGQLVGALWSTDGCIDATGAGGTRIIYTSVSRPLCEDIQHALQRLGIVSSVRTTSVLYKGERRAVSTAQVVSREGRRRFLSLAIEGVIPVLRSAVPLRDAPGLIAISNQGSDATKQPRLDPHLWWDRVQAVERQGEEQTYDVEVPGPHSFVADGIVTHNTTSADASQGSDYRRRLTLDTQVSLYFDGALSVGLEADVCLYDVLTKPGQKPLEATPLESRKYTQPKSRACKECGKKNPAPGTHLDAETGTHCENSRVITDPGGALYAGQRALDETVEEYRERIVAAVSADPSKYFQRAEIVRLGDEHDDHAWNAWNTVRAIEESRRAVSEARDVRAAVQNPSACHRFGAECGFWPVCAGYARLDDATRYRRLDTVHPELATYLQESPDAA